MDNVCLLTKRYWVLFLTLPWENYPLLCMEWFLVFFVPVLLCVVFDRVAYRLLTTAQVKPASFVRVANVIYSNFL